VRTGRGWSPLGRPKGRWEAITKMDFKERGWEEMDCTHVAQDMEQWRAALITVLLNFEFHEGRRMYFVAERQLASQESCYSMQFI
jgi:hypothetical protein